MKSHPLLQLHRISVFAIRHAVTAVALVIGADALCAAGQVVPAHPHISSNTLQKSYTRRRRDTRITVSNPVWSPDSRDMFYIVSESPVPQSGGEWKTLFAAHRNGSRVRKLYTWQSPGEKHPDESALKWSPDSSHILMLVLNFFPAQSVNADGVRLVDIDPETGTKRDLSKDIEGKSNTGSILWRPDFYSFSPDARHLLITLGAGRQVETNKRLVCIDYSTGERRVLTSDKMASFAARWSPDSTEIAYISVPDSGGPLSHEALTNDAHCHHLHIVSANGEGERALTYGNDYNDEEPNWSQDGSKITFVRRNRSNRTLRGLWEIRSDGSHLRLIRALRSRDER